MARLASTTYGDALYEVAVKHSKADELYKDAVDVLEVFDNNKDLEKMLNHPKIDKEEKQRFIQDVFSKFVSRDIIGMMVLMVSKDRQKFIPDALKYFCERILEYKKIGTAYVTTAFELSDSQKEKVEARLLETTQYVEFKMNYSVDESLIGGMVIRIGDRVVDSSIKTQLDELAKQLNRYSLV